MSNGTHTARLRPLDRPTPLQVRSDAEGCPLRVYRRGRAQGVVAIRERWRIDDEWWRDPIRRVYSEVVLENGRPVVLYQDLVDGRWYEQGGGG